MVSPAQRCTSCGLPLEGVSCATCGGSARALPLADGEDASGIAFAAPCDRAGLAPAFAAWESGDAVALISACAKVAGATDLLVVDHGEGPIVRALVHKVALFAQSRADGTLSIETPVARLPLTHYVPALRLLLELSDRDGVPIRFSVRGELVVALFAGRIMGVPPPTLTAIFEGLAASATDAGRHLVGLLRARPISPEEHAVMSPDSLRVKLAPASSARVASAPSAPSSLTAPRVPSSLTAPRVPSSLTAPRVASSPSGPRAPSTPSGPRAPSTKPPPVHKLDSVPPVASAHSKPTAPPPADLFADDLPPVLGGRAQASAPGRQPPKAETKSPERSRLSQPARPMTSLRTPDPANEPRAGTLVSEVGGQSAPKKSGAASFGVPSLVDPNIDPLGDTFIGAKSVGSRPAGPGQGLSELLVRAQTLGVVLSFADQPATMCLLIRATLYQAILDHDAAVPGAVAHLAEQTTDQTREIYITAPGKRRGVMAIPAAAPAFEAMASIVEQRCEMPVARPFTVTPITTSQDAKQHLARYVSEIDQAPKDVDLRQFLAVGAVAELLVRTKLPPATQERLRGIMAHAKKEGPKQAVADVIMTALTRMMA